MQHYTTNVAALQKVLTFFVIFFSFFVESVKSGVVRNAPDNKSYKTPKFKECDYKSSKKVITHTNKSRLTVVS